MLRDHRAEVEFEHYFFVRTAKALFGNESEWSLFNKTIEKYPQKRKVATITLD